MANEITDAELDAIEARADAATPGPWEPSKNEPGDVVVWGPREDDALFIACARYDVPALVRALRAARKRIAELENGK